MFKTITVCLLLLFLTSACARKTMLISEPAGARVSVNGEQVCTTPCDYSYKTGAADETYQVVLEKDGYEPFLYEVKADEVDKSVRKTLWTAGLVIPGGSILWVSSMFTNKLKESYSFVLREEETVVARIHP